MTKENTVNIKISLCDPDLDEEELDHEMQKMLREIDELDEVEKASLVKVDEAPKGSKSIAGFILGALQADITIEGLKSFIGFMGNRYSNKPIELALTTPDGTQLNLKVSKSEDFTLVLQEINELISKQ